MLSGLTLLDLLVLHRFEQEEEWGEDGGPDGGSLAGVGVWNAETSTEQLVGWHCMLRELQLWALRQTASQLPCNTSQLHFDFCWAVLESAPKCIIELKRRQKCIKSSKHFHIFHKKRFVQSSPF